MMMQYRVRSDRTVLVLLDVSQLAAIVDALNWSAAKNQRLSIRTRMRVAAHGHALRAEQSYALATAMNCALLEATRES